MNFINEPAHEVLTSDDVDCTAPFSPAFSESVLEPPRSTFDANRALTPVIIL